jgi:hypothetical protein
MKAARDGQHSGVVAMKSEKRVPWSTINRNVRGMVRRLNISRV